MRDSCLVKPLLVLQTQNQDCRARVPRGLDSSGIAGRTVSSGHAWRAKCSESIWVYLCTAQRMHHMTLSLGSNCRTSSSILLPCFQRPKNMLHEGLFPFQLRTCCMNMLHVAKNMLHDGLFMFQLHSSWLPWPRMVCSGFERPLSSPRSGLLLLLVMPQYFCHGYWGGVDACAL